MNKLALKVSVGTFAAAAALVIFAGSAFASDSGCTISGNGVFSHNKCVLVNRTSTKTVTVNKAFVGNLVVAVAATGGNSVEDNTGGNSTITTGNSSVTTVIVNVVNTNVSL